MASSDCQGGSGAKGAATAAAAGGRRAAPAARRVPEPSCGAVEPARAAPSSSVQDVAHNGRGQSHQQNAEQPQQAQALQPQPQLLPLPLPQQQQGVAVLTSGDPTTKECHRRVRFAQGPLEGKYCTLDGHPDHEGRLAKQKRHLGLSWGHDLTPSSVRALESGPDALGDECQPSLQRLKRRVGLLPLRKRPRDYLTWMLDKAEKESDEEDAPSAVTSAKPTRKHTRKQQQQQQQQQQPGLQYEPSGVAKRRAGVVPETAAVSSAAATAPARSNAHVGGQVLETLPQFIALENKLQHAQGTSTNGSSAVSCQQQQQQQRIQPPRLLRSGAAGREPEQAQAPMVTFGRRHDAPGLQGVGIGSAAPPAQGAAPCSDPSVPTRGSRRLGGLGGPIGAIRSSSAAPGLAVTPAHSLG